MKIQRLIKKFMDSRKGSVFEAFGSLAVGITTTVIVLAIGFLIISQSQDQIASIQGINVTNVSDVSTAYNATTTLQSALGEIPGWVPLIVIATIGALLLGLVAMFRRR